jgi:hypothetical protein
MKKVYKWLTAKTIRLILTAIIAVLGLIFGFNPDIYSELIDILTQIIISLFG